MSWFSHRIDTQGHHPSLLEGARELPQVQTTTHSKPVVVPLVREAFPRRGGLQMPEGHTPRQAGSTVLTLEQESDTAWRWEPW